MELFAIPTAVALSQCTGVLGYGCPTSFSMSLKIIPVWQVSYNAPSLTSAADAMTNLKLMWNAPLKQMGFPFLGVHPMKNVCKRGFVLMLLTSKMHRSVYLISRLMHGSGFLRPRCGRGNPIIVCILPLFCQMLLFVPQLLSWGPLTPSCWWPAHNTKCFQRFVGHVWFLLRLVLGMCPGGGRLGYQCQISLAPVSKDMFAAFWV